MRSFYCALFQELPKEFKEMIKRDGGLVQFFYCQECMSEDDHFEDLFFVEEKDLGIASLQQSSMPSNEQVLLLCRSMATF